jgi:transposase
MLCERNNLQSIFLKKFLISKNRLKLFVSMRVYSGMNATELQQENERLKELLKQAQHALSTQTAELEQERVERLQAREQHATEVKQHEAEAKQHEAEIQQFAQTLEDKQRSIAQLEHQIKLLLQKIKGSRQEWIDPDQLTLFSLEELEEIAAQLQQGQAEDPLIDTDQSKGNRRRSGRSGKLPDHLLREIVRHELDESQRSCPCCGEQRHEIGVETSEQLELIPAQLKVIQHDRVKYACRTCQDQGLTGNVAIADKPPQPIEKGLPAPGLCAYTVLSKFGDHTPLYRTEDITSRFGYTIRRSTQCNWQASLAELALALVMRMKFLILQSNVIHTDDTSIKLLEGGPAQTAKFWPYLGDCDQPYIVFDFTRTRERDGPVKFLEGFTGFLQADAYSGYDRIYAGDTVKEVACWVHARRYWHQALDNDLIRANKALSFIARLSQIEKQLRLAYPTEDLQGHRDFAAVAAARQTHAVPILESFQAWLDSETGDKRILPKSPIRKAFTYTLNQWDALCRYTTEGYLSYSNNLAERTVKIPAIGRKNYLFVASANGGNRAAIHYSLVSSAKANGVEPYAWLRDVFTCLPDHRQGDAFEQANNGQPVISDELDDLLPDRWLKEHPQHKWTIDEIRRAEREAKEA